MIRVCWLIGVTAKLLGCDKNEKADRFASDENEYLFTKQQRREQIWKSVISYGCVDLDPICAFLGQLVLEINKSVSLFL